MKDGFIKTAAGTPEIRVGDCGFNAGSIVKMCGEAAAKGVKLLVLPELCVTGYTCGDLFFQKTLIDEAEKALNDISQRTAEMDMVIVLGCPVEKNGKLFNSAPVLYKGAVLGVVSKKYLPNHNEFYEKRHFTPGHDNMIFQCSNLPEFCFGVEICEDLWSVKPPSGKLALAGATIIANPSASNEMIGKSAYRRELVSGQSGRLISGYVYASAGDGESTGDTVFGGHNIIAQNGVVCAESNLFENGLLIADIDVKRIASERLRNTTFKHKNNGVTTVYFDMEPVETKLSGYISKTPFIPDASRDIDERCKSILLMQSNGLKKRLTHTSVKKAVIGISGGLDSCLALLVTVKAMDLLHRPHSDIIAVTMPCFGTTRRTKSNAQKLCEALGTGFREIDITESVRQHFKDIEHDESIHDVVYENAQARERTQVLMDIANKENGLVIGTGDLSELALGWATYSGDHMSMYGVNASVPKTLVRHIVRYYAECAESEGKTVLSETLRDILDTPVSPELLPANENGEISQVTEDLVGPYELHDFFLYYMVRWGFTPSKIFRLAEYAFAGVYNKETIMKWLRVFYRRFFSQQFKRSCMPDGPKIGSVALSPRGDWRMPSDASPNAWLDDLDSLSEI